VPSGTVPSGTTKRGIKLAPFTEEQLPTWVKVAVPQIEPDASVYTAIDMFVSDPAVVLRISDVVPEGITAVNQTSPEGVPQPPMGTAGVAVMEAANGVAFSVVALVGEQAAPTGRLMEPHGLSLGGGMGS
jgi:hypothetical protein